MSPQALIEARGLHKYYTIKTGMFEPNQSLQALSGASFDLYAGQTLAVVGCLAVVNLRWPACLQ